MTSKQHVDERAATDSGAELEVAETPAGIPSAHSEPEAGTKPHDQAEADAATRPRARTEPDLEPRPDPEPNPDPERAEPKPRARTKPEAGASQDGETKPDGATKPDMRVEGDDELDADATVRPGAEPDTTTEPGNVPDPDDDARPQTWPHSAPEPADPPTGPAPEPGEEAKASAPAGLIGRLRAIRPPTSGKGRVLGAAAALVVLALIGSGIYWYQDTHLPDGVAFRIYGHDVTAQQLDDDVQTYRALYGIQPPGDGPQLDKFRRDFAKAVAVSLVIDKAAADRHIVVADRQASDVLARYINEYYGEGPDGHDRYVQALANQGTSEVKVLAELKRQMALQQLFTQVTYGVTVSGAEVREAFDQRRDQLAVPERRDIHNIVVRTQDEADQVLAQLRLGSNFEQVAQQRSLDGTTKDKGGDLGPVAAADLDKSYADAAFGAPVGAVFGPVQTQFGFNVGKVVASMPAAPAVFDQIKDQFRRRLISEKATALWTSYLAKLIKTADVRYADTYRPADPDALPSPGDAQQAAGQQGVPAAMDSAPVQISSPAARSTTGPGAPPAGSDPATRPPR